MSTGHASSPTRLTAVFWRWCAAARSGQVCYVFGDGEQTRDFVSVHDVAQANLLALISPVDGTAYIYNVVTGTATSLNTILRSCKRWLALICCGGLRQQDQVISAIRRVTAADYERLDGVPRSRW